MVSLKPVHVHVGTEYTGINACRGEVRHVHGYNVIPTLEYWLLVLIRVYLLLRISSAPKNYFPAFRPLLLWAQLFHLIFYANLHLVRDDLLCIIDKVGN